MDILKFCVPRCSMSYFHYVVLCLQIRLFQNEPGLLRINHASKFLSNLINTCSDVMQHNKMFCLLSKQGTVDVERTYSQLIAVCNEQDIVKSFFLKLALC